MRPASRDDLESVPTASAATVPAPHTGPVELDSALLHLVSGGLPRVGGWSVDPIAAERAVQPCLPRVGGW